MDKKKMATFTFAFTGEMAEKILERFAAYLWDGGLEEEIEQSFLWQYNMDCDDLIFGSMYHCIVNTNKASDVTDDNSNNSEKEKTVVGEPKKDTFLFSFSGKKAEVIAERFAAYFWDGGFEEYFEQYFLACYGMSCDDITFDTRYHCTINTNGAHE